MFNKQSAADIFYSPFSGTPPYTKNIISDLIYLQNTAHKRNYYGGKGAGDYAIWYSLCLLST